MALISSAGAALLQRVAGRARAQQLAEIALLRMPRQRQDLHARRALPHRGRRLQAVHAGHADVHQQHVRLERHRGVDGLLAVDGFTHDLQVGLPAQQQLEGVPDRGVVVCEDKANRIHGVAPRRSLCPSIPSASANAGRAPPSSRSSSAARSSDLARRSRVGDRARRRPLALVDRERRKNRRLPSDLRAVRGGDPLGGGASLARAGQHDDTGASGTADQPLPANVRMYDIAGGPHIPAPKAPACTLTPGRLDWSPLSRALLLHLDAWVSRGTKPPASELMSLEAAGGEPPALRAPTRLSAAVIQVPKRDQDGNALGGVRLPDVAVPTGTNGAQNQPQTFTCMLIGSFSPFAATKAERERTGDARPSIEERYHGRDDYVNRIRIAAQDLLARGFLLPEDAAVIVQEAASTNLFAPAPTNAEPR